MRRREILAEVTRLFGGKRTSLGKAAFRAVKFHIRMADYIKQAPIIVAMMVDKPRRINDYGTTVYYSCFDDQKFMRKLGRLCAERVKLRDILALFEINPALRNIPAAAVWDNAHSCVRHFFGVNTSALAQQLAKRERALHRQYLEQVRDYALKPTYEGSAPIHWVAENIPVGQHDIGHIMDMLRARKSWKAHWKWRDLEAEMRKWEETFAQVDSTLTAMASLQSVRPMRYVGVDWGVEPSTTATEIDLRREAMEVRIRELELQMHRHLQSQFFSDPYELDDPLTPHADVIKEHSSDGLWIGMLNTARELKHEGVAMSHCVGDYAPQVKSGSSLIYSVREGDRQGKSLATMELTKGVMLTVTQPAGVKGKVTPSTQTWSITQIKAYKNHKPTPRIENFARDFANQNFMIRAVMPWETEYHDPRYDPRAARPRQSASLMRAAEAFMEERLFREQQIHPHYDLPPRGSRERAFRLTVAETQHQRYVARGEMRDMRGRPWFYDFRRDAWEYVMRHARDLDRRTRGPDMIGYEERDRQNARLDQMYRHALTIMQPSQVIRYTDDTV